MSKDYPKQPLGGNPIYRWRGGNRKRTGLTPRELQILIMIADGLTGKEIAYKLQISEKCQDYHRSTLCDILNTRCVATLTKIAVGFGLSKL